jgi:hypothetical protein
MAATTQSDANRVVHRPKVVHHHVAPPHKHHFLGSIGHGIGNAARGVGHAAAQGFNFVHHHAAASVGVLALIGIIVGATVARTVVRDRMLRLAHWMGVPRVGPPPPGPMD